MPRHVKRQQSSTGLYHVFVRGINKEKIFEHVREKAYFKRTIKEYLSKYDVEIHAYCIMSNHAHLIIKSDGKQKLSYFMSNILAKYAQYYNYKHNRNGHVFQDRFGSECIESEKYYWNCIKYIHMNPVKAFMVSSALEYKYSSLGEYKRGKPNLLHEKAIENYRRAFGNWSDYMNYHKTSQEKIFLGMKEEVYLQRKERAVQILWEMQEEEKLEETIQIFEERELREKFKEQISNQLKVSKQMSDRLYTEIKKQYFML